MASTVDKIPPPNGDANAPLKAMLVYSWYDPYLGVVVLVLVIFMLQNTEDVKVDFLFWDFTFPVWLLTLASAAIGAFVWLGLGILRRHRRRKERREDRRD